MSSRETGRNNQMNPPQLEQEARPQPKRAGALAAFLDRWQWIVVAALCGLALWIRVVPRYDLVFQQGIVNFQEVDAWYHVRVAENLVRHFPWRIMVDPYVAFGHVQDTTTAPFYDWLLGLIAWLAGGGSPSEALLHVIAAWYPAVLAVFAVVTVFVLGRRVFGLPAALVAAAVLATLPGHFLRVSSLGFTDHHIMESLLAVLFFLLLLRAFEQPRSIGRALIAGLTFAAYLLTFHGASFLVGFVLIWAVYDRVRSLWPREEPAPSFQPLYIVFLVALCVCLLFRHVLWMNYSIAGLAAGGVAIAALEWFANWCRRFRHTRLAFFGTLATAGALALIPAALFVSSWRHLARRFLARLSPAFFGNAGGVNELQSLIYDKGHLTLTPVMLQFYGAFLFAFLGLLWLGESSIRGAKPGRSLIFFWGLITGVMALGELRMTYYFATAVALLAGYAAANLFASGRKTAWATGAGLVVLVFGPNLYAAANADQPNGISADWKETMDWMRTSTPEPFGDPAFYYARYRRQDFGPAYQYPSSAYSVMAWWDYGYWLINVGRRIPVTNPTQANADDAADFYLAQSESGAMPLLRKWRTRYVVVNERLPLWPTTEEQFVGDFPAFFDYSHTHRRNEYLLVAYQTDAQGKRTAKAFYRPAYYRSMVVRLFVYGGQPVDGHDGAEILWLRKAPGGRGYPEVIGTRRLQPAEDPLAAEAACRDEGCVLVGDNPLVSCVPLEALRNFRPVFSSTSASMGIGSTARKEVQVYEVTEPSK
jgi:dolichyl-phosphooligosaccharide-protein glycotransferase